MPDGEQPEFWTKFYAYEVLGGEVFKDTRDGEIVVLLNRADLKPGDTVFVPWLGGTAKATVKQFDNGVLYAEDEHNIYDLTFDGDHRRCWTSGGAGNKRALERIKIKE